MKCGGCTLCCELFPVEWLKKRPLERCQYQCDIGCRIHDKKHQECKGFDCMYVQMEKASEHFRPDKCHVVFEKISENIIHGTEDSKQEVTEAGKLQVNNFLEQGFSVVMMRPKDKMRKLFVAKNHKGKDVKEEFQIHLEKRYGRSDLQYGS